MPQRPKAVLFDLDGTLIDSIDLILQSAEHAFAKCGRSCPPRDEWVAGIGIPLATMFERYTPSRADVDELISAYREYQLEHHDRLVHCYDAVAETVRELDERGHPMAIVTSKSDWLARRGLDHVGILRHFATIVGCDSSTRHKPHPEPVLLALDRLGYEPAEAVFVGDSNFDMEAGNAAGVTTVAALWGPFTRQQLAASRPTHYISSITDLQALL